MGGLSLAHRAVVVAAGLALDHVMADPQRGHPVALFGRAAQACERWVYRDSAVSGVAFWVVCVVPPTAVAWWCERRLPRVAKVVAGVVVAGFVFGGRTLGIEAVRIESFLTAGHLAAARERLPWLVGRDPRHLAAPEVARAVVESVAENTSDAVVAPMVAGLVAGVPGLVAYRCINTLDAMVGHRTARYERFGWFSAKVDDVVNLIPARLTAASVVACAGVVGGSSMRAWRAWQDDAWAHPSPNAGPIEAATAGALDVQLGGANTYASGVEDRGTYGSGGAVTPSDISRAVRLCRAATIMVLAGTVVAGWLSKGLRRW